MAVGWAAMVLSLIIGTTVGVLAGFVKKADGPLMRLTDLFLSLPILPLYSPLVSVAATDDTMVPWAEKGSGLGSSLMKSHPSRILSSRSS